MRFPHDLRTVDLAFQTCNKQELVCFSYTAQLANVQTAQGNNARVNTDIWIQASDFISCLHH